MTSLRDEPVSRHKREPEPIAATYALAGDGASALAGDGAAALTGDGASIEQALNRLSACSSVTGPDLYHAILLALSDALGARWGLIGTVDGESATTIRTVTVLADGSIEDDLEYELAGTPCEEVLRHGTVCFTGDLKRRFPDDVILHEMGVAYYLGTPLRASDGSLLGLLAVQHDAPLDDSLQPRALVELLAGRTAAALELERKVRALRQSEHNLADFFDNAAIGLHWVSADGEIIRANRAELELMGYADRQDEYIGRHITEFHADAPVIEDILARLGRGETISDCPARLIRRDGSIRHVLITSNALFEDGRFIHTRCFTRDVTEQRAAEEALRTSEEFNQRLIDSSSDCITVLDLDGRLLSMSKGGQRRMAISDLAPLLNRKWTEWWKQQRAEAEHAVRAAAAGGAGRFEGFCRAGDGSPRWWEIIVSPILGAGGRPERLLAVSRDVTERKVAEESQRQQAAELQTLLETLPVGVFFAHDPECRRITGNRAGCEMLRMPVQSNISKTAPDDENPHHFRICRNGQEVPPHDLPVQRAARGEAVRDEEVETVFDDGGVTHALISAAPLFDAEGNVRGSVASILDITERKRAEERLRESERRYRALIDLLPAGVYACDRDGTITAFNRRAVELWGREPKIGDSDECFCGALRLHWPDGRPLPHDKTPMAECLIDGRPKRDLEVVIERPDGERVIVLVNISPVHDERGNVVGAINCFQDITARKDAEEAVHRSEEEFRALAEHTPDIVSRLDRELRHLYINPAVEAATGIKPEAFLGRTNREMGMPAEHCGRWERVCREVFEAGELREVEFGFTVPATGEVRHYIARIVPEFSAPGEVESVLAVSRDITARREAEITHSRLAAIVESTQDAVISKTADGVITSWNRGAEGVFGYTAEEAIGRRLTALIIPPERHDEEKAILDRIRSGETVEHYETVRLTKDGRRLDVWLSVSPVLDEHGRVIGAAKIARNITDRKQAEAQIRESETRLKLAMEAGRMGAWEWDIDSAAVRWSPGLEAIHGLETGSCGGTFDDFARDIHHDDRERVLETVRRALESRSDYYTEYRIVLPDKRIRWVEARGRIVLDESGKPQRMAGVCMDVTDRRKAEEEARAESTFRQAVENSVAAGLAAFDPDGCVTYVNRAFCEMIGCSEADALGKAPPFTWWPREDLSRCRAMFESMMRGEAPASGFEARFLRSDGSLHDVLIVPSPLIGAGGEVRGYLAAVTDITTQKRGEAELARHRDQLEDLVIERTVELEASYEQLRQTERMAALGTLSAGLGHDMGNLLLPLRLRLDAIERKIQMAEGHGEPEAHETGADQSTLAVDVRTDIEAIRKCAEYMQRLTNGLRLFALDPNDDEATEDTTDLHCWWHDFGTTCRSQRCERLPNGPR